jgi:hypothetical protein
MKKEYEDIIGKIDHGIEEFNTAGSLTVSIELSK